VVEEAAVVVVAVVVSETEEDAEESSVEDEDELEDADVSCDDDAEVSCETSVSEDDVVVVMSGSASDADAFAASVAEVSSVMLSPVLTGSVSTGSSIFPVICQRTMAATPTMRAAAIAPERARMRLRFILLIVASLFLITKGLPCN
jgi:hypothetical protein